MKGETMPRSDNDSWDITESVGTTALGVAAARAAETDGENPLIRDPFARLFLDAAGPGLWSMFASPTVPAELADADPDLSECMKMRVDFMAVRTAFFDEFFVSAADAGIRQVVILASGLDARAWRLPWPDGTTVYELDQPKVLRFKSATLQSHAARPTCTQVDVPVDLRQDWPNALQRAGFDPSAATAWSAEGLLRFLTARAQDLLFERIDALSARGSRLATNAPGKDFLNPERLARERRQMQRMREFAARVFDTEIPDVQDLWYAEERTDVGNWLSERGWDATVTTAAELLTHYGRTSTDDDAYSVRSNQFISAVAPTKNSWLHGSTII
jgi:methyltransferase (TIGR00027 family)